MATNEYDVLLAIPITRELVCDGTNSEQWIEIRLKSIISIIISEIKFCLLQQFYLANKIHIDYCYSNFSSVKITKIIAALIISMIITTMIIIIIIIIIAHEKLIISVYFLLAYSLLIHFSFATWKWSFEWAVNYFCHAFIFWKHKL